MSVPLAALRERIPGVVGARLDRISGGWDSEVHVLDRTWVVRVARRPEIAAQLSAEVALLAELGPLLPVAVPLVEASGPDWVAYRWIDGQPIGGRTSAADVAAFLSALHRFPVARAGELGLPNDEWAMAVARKLDEFERRVLPLLGASERAVAKRRFDRFRNDAASFAFRPALIHADLGPEHLLCDAEGRLVGVIDWTDARIGDPALDFAWLLHGLGPAFATELLAAYEGEVDATVAERAAFFHLLGPWHEVTYGLDRELPAYVESGLAGVRERLR